MAGRMAEEGTGELAVWEELRSLEQLGSLEELGSLEQLRSRQPLDLSSSSLSGEEGGKVLCLWGSVAPWRRVERTPPSLPGGGKEL